MTKIFQKIALVVFSLSLISLNLSPQAIAQTQPSTSKISIKPPCRVDMPLAHVSTHYAEANKVLAVKVNVVVICDKPITHLTLHINLYKKAFIFPVLLETQYIDKTVQILPNKPFKVSGPTFVCVNWKRTAFFSEVSSTATIGGELMAAPKRISFSKIIECGN